jgi:hypothetical protein
MTKTFVSMITAVAAAVLCYPAAAAEHDRAGGQQTGAQQTQTGAQQTGAQTGAQQRGGDQQTGAQAGTQQAATQQTGAQQAGGQQTGAQQAGAQQTGALSAGAQPTGGPMLGVGQQGKPEPQKTRHLVPANELRTAEVQNRQNENIGNINTLLVDPHNGQIRYAVIGVGGFLGMGTTDVAVPWEAMQVHRDADRTHVVLDATRDRLQQAPRVEGQNYDRLFTQDGDNQTRQFWGVGGG